MILVVEDGVPRGWGCTLVTPCFVPLGLDQPKLAQAGVPTATDNQMVVHHYPERGSYSDDVVGHADVGTRWGWITRRVIMHEYQR